MEVNYKCTTKQGKLLVIDSEDAKRFSRDSTVGEVLDYVQSLIDNDPNNRAYISIVPLDR